MYQTAEMMSRLKNILPAPGTRGEQKMYLEEVILPEVWIIACNTKSTIPIIIINAMLFCGHNMLHSC